MTPLSLLAGRTVTMEEGTSSLTIIQCIMQEILYTCLKINNCDYPICMLEQKVTKACVLGQMIKHSHANNIFCSSPT